MPRKRWRTRLSTYDVPSNDIDPAAPIPGTDHDRVRRTFDHFDELAALSSEIHEQLVADLVRALGFLRCGVDVGRRGVSNGAVAQQIFLSDVERALKQAGLPAKRWSKRYDDGDGPSPDAPESFLFRLAREVADDFGMTLPRDLKLPARRATQHKYGTMSPAMKTAQKGARTDLELIKAQLEHVRQQSASAKKIRSRPVPMRIAPAMKWRWAKG